MNILSMLMRLESALGRSNLMEQMMLIPHCASVEAPPSQTLNLVVGYNGSPRSQTALDLTLWIAYQTRLATSQQVTVQVVYVMDLKDNRGQVRTSQFSMNSVTRNASKPHSEAKTYRQAGGFSRSAGAIAEFPSLTELSLDSQSCQLDQFEWADLILWQARHLAEEWRGSLKTHLRFGQIAAELRHIVVAESAAMLLLGCESVDNPIVQQLGSNLPCPVLGIPSTL